MSDKIQTSKEPGVCVETGYSRSADPSPRPTHKQYSSSNFRKQQSRNKGSYGSSKDKRQQYPRSGPGHSPLYAKASGRSFQGPDRTGRRHSGDQRWSDQRNQSPKQEKWHHGNDGLKETDNPLSNLAGVSGSPTSRPGGGDGGRRKSTPVSLNHLLNFTVAPTERRNSASNGGTAPLSLLRRRRSRQGHSYNKEQFLQANCQFVVSTSGDYTIHSGDPDRLVEWDCIEQVRLFCHQIPSCPICLYPPTAAKITRCGHVYCWSCVLHYLALGEKKWRKCPICYESIYKNDLKSVIALSSPQFKVGDTITMKLMLREKGTTLVCPKNESSGQKPCLLSLRDESSMRHFVKLLSATPTETLELITSAERCELERQLGGLSKDSESEKRFVEAALEELKMREAALKEAQAHGNEVSIITQGLQVNDYKEIVEPPSNSDDNNSPTGSTGPVWTAYADSYFEGDFAAPFSDLEEEGECEGEASSSGSSSSPLPENNPSGCEGQPTPPVEVTVDSIEPEIGLKLMFGGNIDCQLRGQQLSSQSIESESPFSFSSADSPEHPSSGGSQVESTESSPQKDPLLSGPTGDSPRLQNSGEFIYFYQSADGQHLYIHPVNAKCLAKEYGGLDNAPEEIKATVVEMEQLTMSEDIRGRYRYLSHLPLTCEFVLCELDLKPPVLSQDTLKVFSEELQKRKQKRIKKKREEKRRERKREPNPEPTFRVPTEMTPENFHDFLSLASSPPLRSSMPPQPLDTHPVSRPMPPQPLDTHPVSQLSQQERGMSNGNGESCDQCGEADATPSFAQALRGKSAPLWPVRPSPRPEGSPGGVADVRQKTRRDGKEEQNEDSESHVIPSFQNAFNEALFSASVSVIAAQNASGGKPGSRTAKKGRKKLVLFSTGGMRGVN